MQGSHGETDIENRPTDKGRGEERVRCMEGVTWKHITICKIDSQREFAVRCWELKQGLCVKLEGCVGREVKEGGGICLSVVDSC